MSQKDREVIWSPLAEKELEEQLKYIAQQWGIQASIDYLERIDEVLKAVTNNPDTYYQVDANRHIQSFLSTNTLHCTTR